jgi:hypothetical protein
MHDTGDERRDELPEHEYRDIERDGDVGAGVMGTGGTATDRGTGTLGGQAQGDDEGGFEEREGDARRDGVTGGLGDAIAGAVEGDDEPPRLGTPAVPSHPEIDPTHLRR